MGNHKVGALNSSWFEMYESQVHLLQMESTEVLNQGF